MGRSVHSLLLASCFGEEKKIEKNQPDTPLAVRKKEDTEHAQSESINDEQVISNKENYDTIPDSIPPIGSTDEGPMNVKLPEYEKEDDVPDQIKLPDSFGEDIIKNPDSSTSANEPIQYITNPGENTRKNDAPVVSKTPDHQAEEKNVTAKDTIEPKTEELTIPQLPGAGEVKEEASLKNDAAKEITASKIEEMPTAQEEPVVKLELPAGKPAGAATPKPSNIDVPEYAGAASQPNEEEVAISKYKESLETKSSKPVVVPKLSESELSLENKSKQVDLKASDLEAFDTDQLKFVNNEAQVLILPNDDIVLGTLIEEAKLDQIDFRAYVDKFWENYNRLKREPKRLEIEKFIYNYDELFDTNN